VIGYKRPENIQLQVPYGSLGAPRRVVTDPLVETTVMTDKPSSAWLRDQAKPIEVKRRRTTAVKVPLPLDRRWAVSIPGRQVHAFAGDTATNSLIIGDNWGVPYGALRIHRLDAATGSETAAILTRHQPVNGLLALNGRLLAATDSRLFDLTLPGLAVTKFWERRLVRYSQQLELDGGYVVQANWIRPYIGVLDTATGAVRRMKAGPQPLLFHYQGKVRALSALDGGMASVDTVSATLVDRVAVPPVSAIAAGREIWVVVAGQAQSPEVYPKPPPVPLPQFRRATHEVVRLTGEAVSFTLDGPCRRLWCDDARDLLWCFLEGERSHGASTRLCAIRQATGEVVARYETETAATSLERDPELGSVPVQLAYLDVGLGIVVTTQHESSRRRGNTVVSDTSTLTCYSLPLDYPPAEASRKWRQNDT
jgi:hypothetical protein